MLCDWKSNLAGLSLLLLPLAASAHELDVHAAARSSIRSDDLRPHVSLLADDTLEGREAGSRGGYTAGNYLVRYFQNHLQAGAGDSGYFQIFQGRCRNILGILPGTDPELRHEFILLGAHYDHVGYGNARNSQGPIGVIHNGADDNASGTSAVLEIIEAFATGRVPSRRSILFALWDGEEKGLLGSEHWAQNPTVPLEQLKFVINLDMIGRLGEKPLEVIGSRTMPGLRELVAQANYPDDLRLTFPWKIEENSDHHTFFQRSIPFLMFHTGLHDDYHRPTDDPEYLDLIGLQQTTRLIFNTLVTLSNRDQLAPCRTAARHENESRRREYERPLPLPAPRLGVTLADQRAELEGLTIQDVQTGSAAARAGLLAGDRLTHVNGAALLSISTLQQLAVTESEIQLTMLRGDGSLPQEVAVSLEGPPSRIGISWRSNPAEPHSVTIVRVIPHSIASQAGIHVGDRIHQLDGTPIEDPQAFYSMTQAMQLPASVLLERGGRLIELTLPSPAKLSANQDEA
jgi:hypothetical protein